MQTVSERCPTHSFARTALDLVQNVLPAFFADESAEINSYLAGPAKLSGQIYLLPHPLIRLWSTMPSLSFIFELGTCSNHALICVVPVGVRDDKLVKKVGGVHVDVEEAFQGMFRLEPDAILSKFVCIMILFRGDHTLLVGIHWIGLKLGDGRANNGVYVVQQQSCPKLSKGVDDNPQGTSESSRTRLFQVTTMRTVRCATEWMTSRRNYSQDTRQLICATNISEPKRRWPDRLRKNCIKTNLQRPPYPVVNRFLV
ncbi:uncharacterized protein C8R40DRAFT_166120 [Lentinula edodes]|uniref:uncharacterized protein n=1 Tax=Lentinula edodes TaxID=5353 RepID=UPI001E8EBDB8|nr:uncharacterized protein C8R40DRAFT_166120 [Lentinula edodes]KAH7875869.1 hypothetical protein C8R40DRAFT_166120 [Lentinula edodes]